MLVHITVPVFMLMHHLFMAVAMVMHQVVLQQQVIIIQYLFITPDGNRSLPFTENKHTIRHLLGQKYVVRYD